MTNQPQQKGKSTRKQHAKEVVKHVHLERTRPKLSKYDDKDAERKAQKSAARRSRTQSSTRGKKTSKNAQSRKAPRA